MKIVIMGDAHLKGLDDPEQQVVCDFFDSLTGIDRLIILGDLFDFWAGTNKVALREYKPVLDSLKALVDRGIPLTYIEGNHDFNMGPIFTNDLKADVHANSTTMTLTDGLYYLIHGDTVRMTRGYRFWRKFLRSGLFKVLCALVGSGFVWRTAAKLSKKSRDAYLQEKERGKPDIDEYLQIQTKGLIRENGYEGVLMGHSHVARSITLLAGGLRGKYANPGGWRNDRTYLVYKDGPIRIKTYEA